MTAGMTNTACALAKDPLVRAFMMRVIDEVRDPLTGDVRALDLARRAAGAFGVDVEGGETVPRALVDVAARVIALTNACARFRQ